MNVLLWHGTYSYRGQKDRHTRVGQKDGKPKTHNVPPLFFEKAGDNKTVGEVWECTFTFVVKMPEKQLSSNCEKSVKINLRIISKPHAHLQSMIKTFVKFHKNQKKTI